MIWGCFGGHLEDVNVSFHRTFNPELFTTMYFSFQLLNEPGLGEGIDPGKALTPFPSSIVLDEIQTHDLPIVSRVH